MLLDFMYLYDYKTSKTPTNSLDSLCQTYNRAQSKTQDIPSQIHCRKLLCYGYPTL